MAGSESFSSAAGNAWRGLIWRIGRKLYCLARGDVPNRPDSNGEYWLLEQFFGGVKEKTIVLDVGANKGDWACRALDEAKRSGADVVVHAFEPCSGTRALLAQRLADRDNVQIHATALSSASGAAEFYSNGVGWGTNSLSAVSGSESETVQLTTLDAFLGDNGIDRVGFLKIDTEGFDFDILKGAQDTLANGRVELVQFEYNWRWLINHASLRDVFELMKGKPYRIGKMIGHAIEVFDQWHFELDRYFENNYVLIREGSRLLDRALFVSFDGSNCVRRVGMPSNQPNR